MSDVLPCRSVAEAQLYLDLSGWLREGRTHRLEEMGGRWIAVYEGSVAGRRAVLRFEAPEDPFAHADALGGADPSRLIDPGQFLAHAAQLASSVPLDPEDVDPAWRATGARRLEVAARCIDEVIKFVPANASRVPPEAFFTKEGRALRAHEPARFEQDRLEAVVATYRDVARRYASAPEPALRPVIRPATWDGADTCVVRRLLPLPDAPWVAYAWDPTPLRAYVSPAMQGKMGLSSDDLHETALARISRQAPPFRTTDLGLPGGAPIPVAIAEGEYASEQILDAAYLRSLATGLGASRHLAVAIPHRGVLLATDIAHHGALVKIARGLHAEARGEPLTASVFLAGDGVLEGRVRT